MAENKLQSHEIGELKELVECCICAKTFNDPRLLPCAHSFCLKCLQDTGSKSSKETGGKMACPLCTVEFTIPPNGFSGLQKNFLVEKLMNLPGLKSLNPTAKKIECDVCVEESDSNSETGVSTAEIYCHDCHQNMCKDCLKQHSRFQGTKSHKVVTIADQDHAELLSKTHSQTSCIHRGRVNLNIFCSDCKTVVCALCFVESHQLHKGADAIKVADDFRKSMKDTAKELNEKWSDVEEKNAELDHNKEEFFQVVEDLERDVRHRFEELKEFGEQQMKELLSELETVRIERFKEIENMKLILNKHEVDIESTKTHCDKPSTNESVLNVCQGMHSFSEQIHELKSAHQEQMQRKINPFQATLKKTSFEALITTFNKNILGSLEIKSKYSTLSIIYAW